MKGQTLLTLGTALAFSAGCGSTMQPAERLSDTKASVRAAEAVGAETQPQSALYLKMARDQIADAEALIANDEHERAALVLDRAKVDAELALAMSKEHQAMAEAQEARRKVEELRQRNSQ